jgi:hypothetical protein
VRVAAGETECQWIAQRIDDGVDFCRQTAARAADGLVIAPFLRAPALCWCALTMVASIIAYSLSGSSAKVLKRLSQTPLAAQREKRLWVSVHSSRRTCPPDPVGRPRDPKPSSVASAWRLSRLCFCTSTTPGICTPIRALLAESWGMPELSRRRSSRLNDYCMTSIAGPAHFVHREVTRSHIGTCRC